ncbi:MAG TPA: thermosome subunit alpha [Thermoplasmata archaeon]|nr:thermosome subunit alpha [Thermoplasmata archaeon]
MLAGTPIILLKEGTERAEGKDAQRDNIGAAYAVANSLRTTLGPRGMDKMMVGARGDVVITNDGATILKEMEIQHPAAKILVEVAKTQDLECGDGTKTAVILTGELLHRAEDLLDEKIHPTAITTGYQIAAEEALKVLTALGRPVRREDTEALRAIAMTSMISKGVAAQRETLGRLAVRAVLEVIEERDGKLRFDRKNIQMVKKQGGEVHDTELLEGRILEKEAVHPSMPRRVTPARIALVEAAFEVKKTEYSAEIRITSPDQLDAFRAEEERMLAAMAKAIVASGANVLVCEKGIEDSVAERLAKEGIYAVKQAKREDLEMLAKATGARIVVRAADLAPADVGRAERVEDRQIGEDHLTLITGCEHARSVSLLIRGGTEHVVTEVERCFTDALTTVGIALEDGYVLTGAGATAAELSLRIRTFAANVGGREQMAVLAFADAMDIIPATLAESAGMDKIDALIELRHQHAGGRTDVGVDVLAAKIAEMGAVAVEPIRVSRQAIEGAVAAATLLLRIDAVISAKRSGAGAAPPPGGGPGF